MCVSKIWELLTGGIWGILKRSLKKYIKDNQIQLEIEAQVDMLLIEYKNSESYKYLKDIREQGFDEIIEYIVNNHTTNIRPKLEELFSNRRYKNEKKEAIFAFFEKLSLIIVEIQGKFLPYELKVITKAQEKTIKKSELKIINEIDGVKKSIANLQESGVVNKKNYDKIGILSINTQRPDSRIQTLIDLKEKALNLTEYFKDYYERYNEINWDEVETKISDFIETQLYEIKDYLLLISANYSTVYAFGKLLGLKRGNVAIVNGLEIWDKQIAQSKNIDIDYSETINNMSKTLNLSLSIGMVNIENQVVEFCNEKENMINIHYGKFLNDNNEFWGLAKAINNKVAEFIRHNKIKKINLFYKGPAELLFVLGQLSNNWCECQIKEYNFLEKDKEKHTYFNGIKI